MQDRINLSIARWFALVGILLLSASLLSCIGGGGGGGRWSDHDFGSNNQDVYLAVGDSITAGSSLENYAQCYIPKLAGLLQKTIVNRATPGAISNDGADILPALLKTTSPGFLLILYGANDLIMGYDITATLDNLRFMIQVAKGNNTIPIIATLTPVSGPHIGMANAIARLNAGIRLLAAEENIYVADMEDAMHWDPDYLLADGLHPNPIGNDVMADTFYDIIK